MDFVLYLAVGAAAGLLAGLLGVGGGLIIVAALAWILPLRGVPADAVMHMALATSLATIVLTSLSSTYAHQRRGAVLWPTVLALSPGLFLGGLLGAQLAALLSTEVLRYGVAVFCLFAAWQLAFGQVRIVGHDPAPRGAHLAIWGSLIGGISALVGIGGGSMTVPLLVWHGVVPVRAVATSAACGFAIALASALGFVWAGHTASNLPSGSLGYVFGPAVVGIALASVISAPLGARLAHRLSGAHLKRVFALFLLLMGLAVWRSG